MLYRYPCTDTGSSSIGQVSGKGFPETTRIHEIPSASLPNASQKPVYPDIYGGVGDPEDSGEGYDQRGELRTGEGGDYRAPDEGWSRCEVPTVESQDQAEVDAHGKQNEQRDRVNPQRSPILFNKASHRPNGQGKREHSDRAVAEVVDRVDHQSDGRVAVYLRLQIEVRGVQVDEKMPPLSEQVARIRQKHEPGEKKQNDRPLEKPLLFPTVRHPHYGIGQSDRNEREEHVPENPCSGTDHLHNCSTPGSQPGVPRPAILSLSKDERVGYSYNCTMIPHTALTVKQAEGYIVGGRGSGAGIPPREWNA